MEQMSGPSDGSRHCWQVSHHWRVALHLDVLVLNVFDFKAVVLEENGVLGVETRFQVLSMEDSLELSEELKGLFDVGDVFEVLIDVVVEF